MSMLFHELLREESEIPITAGAVLLQGFAGREAAALVEAAHAVFAESAPRHPVTPNGYSMSIALSCCGSTGWVSDRRGYRYQELDPQTGRPWPAMPPVFFELGQRAASRAGYAGFAPDTCIINKYVPGAKIGMHRDDTEREHSAPIVSVSLGLPAVFVFGGLKRSDPTQRVRLENGDVVVFGGPARLAYHAVLPLKEGEHPLTGRSRINLTFRRAL